MQPKPDSDQQSLGISAVSSNDRPVGHGSQFFRAEYAWQLREMKCVLMETLGRNTELVAALRQAVAEISTLKSKVYQ